MSSIIQYLLSHNLPQETIILMLVLPIIVTIIAFLRQVIGMKGADMSISIILTLSFLAMGLKYGLVLFFVVVLSSTLIRLIMKQIRLFYLPRTALILIFTMLLVLFVIVEGSRITMSNIVFSPVLAILIMIALVEKLLLIQIQRGWKKATFITGEILFTALLCFLVSSMYWTHRLVLTYPLWIILASIGANIFLGKWTGLRLSEYFRFHETIALSETDGKNEDEN